MQVRSRRAEGRARDRDDPDDHPARDRSGGAPGRDLRPVRATDQQQPERGPGLEALAAPLPRSRGFPAWEVVL